MPWCSSLREHFGETGPQLVLLDLDGTLIDSVPDLSTAVDTMLSGLGRPPAGVNSVSHWIGNGADRLIRRALCNGDENAAEALPAEQVVPARALFDTAYLRALHDATGAYPGAETFLQRVQRAGVPMALITNKPRLFTMPLIESLGWREFFALVICADDLAEKKPSPLPLLHVCHELRVLPAQALMIGDSCNDILAAKAAGIASAGVTYGYNHGQPLAASEPDWLLDSLPALLAD